jgi:PAS domain S-box-containing protein
MQKCTLVGDGNSVGEVEFEELFDIEELQHLQDQFASALGLASLITRPDGTPITRPSNFTRLCEGIIRNTERGRANCARSDAVIGRFDPSGPVVQPCLSGGLLDAGAAIVVQGRHLANWLIGQVRDETMAESQGVSQGGSQEESRGESQEGAPGEERMRAYAREIEADEEDVVRAYRAVPSMSRERFKQVARLLYTMANQLSQAAYRNARQARLIVEHERFEVALRTSEAKFRTLFESMAEGVALHEIILDESGRSVDYRILDVNPAYERHTGLTVAQVQGRLASEAYGVDEPPYLDLFAQVARTGEPMVFETEFSGLARHFSISVVALEGNLFATVFEDITQRKRTQEALAELNRQLKSKNRELEQVVYVASHDLRSPLVNIDGYGRELEYEISELRGLLEASGRDGDSLPADAVQASLREMVLALGYIRKSTAQMDALLKGLLKLSRSGRAVLAIAALDMDDLMAGVANSFEFQIKGIGARMEIGPLPRCRGDAVQVSQIFSNLLNNALKYRDSARPCVIRVSGDQQGDRCAYCIEDNGIGIDPGHVEKIFEVFHRLDPGRDDGEGLGLSIVKQVLGRLDGEIHVESRPGEGSRFRVTLPGA